MCYIFRPLLARSRPNVLTALKIPLWRGALSPFPMLNRALASLLQRHDLLGLRPLAPALAARPCDPVVPAVGPGSGLIAPYPAGRNNQAPGPGRSSGPSTAGR